VPNVNDCGVYDANGREKLANGLNRRIVGYFTSWRTGANNTPSYLVNNIPWDKVTHINYAFAAVDGNARVQLGSGANNPDTGMTWPNIPAAAMDPALPYKGHFNLLSQYKKRYPGVKIMLSVGGWAGSGGFYGATTNADGSLNSAGINTLADSIHLLRRHRHRLRAPDHQRRSRQPARLPRLQASPGGLDEGLQRAAENRSSETGHGRCRRQQVLHADHRRFRVGVDTARRGKSLRPAVPRLRQPDVL
jgi:hypothetical protein